MITGKLNVIILDKSVRQLEAKSNRSLLLFLFFFPSWSTPWFYKTWVATYYNGAEFSKIIYNVAVPTRSSGRSVGCNIGAVGSCNYPKNSFDFYETVWSSCLVFTNTCGPSSLKVSLGFHAEMRSSCLVFTNTCGPDAWFSWSSLKVSQGLHDEMRSSCFVFMKLFESVARFPRWNVKQLLGFHEAFWKCR
jgi:hypothetical protein